MIAEGNRCFAQALPSVPEIIREILGESSFGGRPTVVLFSVLDPLLAVVTDRAYVKILPAILRHFEVANTPLPMRTAGYLIRTVPIAGSGC